MLSTVATSVAVALVLALRGAVRRQLGASAAYLLWLSVPAVWLAVMLPAPRREVATMTQSVAVTVGNLVPGNALANGFDWPGLLLLAWLCGSAVMLIRLWRQQRRFMAALGPLRPLADGTWQAAAAAGLPAAVGLLRPRIVLPAGFAQRYTPHEQALVLHHERIHVRRGDLQVNALAALLCCLYWFNPLLLLALRRCREDQELSCDERVIAAHGDARRSYGMAMLKTELAVSPLPVGCHWQNHHPLKERIAMLKRPVPGRKQWIAMVLLSAGLSFGLGCAAWAVQPAQMQKTTSSAAYYSVKLRLDVDGEARDFEVREHAGAPFAFTMDTPAGRKWKGEFKVEPLDAAKAVLSGTLREGGEVVATPTLVVMNGSAAAIQVGTKDGGSLFKMEAVVADLGAKAVPAAPPQGHISVEPADAPATTANMSPPRYPPSMNTGEVVLKVDVAADGTATGIVVERSSGHADLDEAAMDAARGWKFVPAYKAGKATAGQVRVPVRFEMDEPAPTTADRTS